MKLEISKTDLGKERVRAAQLRLKRVRDSGDQEMRDDKTEVIDIDVETCEVPDAPADARKAMTDAQARMPQSGPAAGEAAVTGGSSGSGGGENVSMDVGMIASIAIEYVKYGVHVSELYSPPRVCKTALKVGLRPGIEFRPYCCRSG